MKIFQIFFSTRKIVLDTARARNYISHRCARRKARVSLVVRECGQIRWRHVAHLRKKTHRSARTEDAHIRGKEERDSVRAVRRGSESSLEARKRFRGDEGKRVTARTLTRLRNRERASVFVQQTDK